MKWPLIRLEELYLEPSRNGVYKSSEYNGHGVPYVKMSQQFSLQRIFPSRIDFELIDLTPKEIEQLKLKDGDLLFSRTSVVPEGVGKCSILQEVNDVICFDSNIIRVRIDSSICSPNFLFYYFLSPVGRGEILSLSNGAAIKTIKGSDLKNILVPFPSLAEQINISNALSAYDDLIENNNRRIALLEESMRLLYREWFVNLRFPGHEQVRVVDGLPEGWTKGVFTDFIEVLSGGTPKTSISEYWGGDIPWFTPQDLTGEFYVLDTLRKITELGLSKCASKLYPRQTVFITARGTVGKCVLASVPMAMSQTNYALLGKNNLSQFYVFLLTLSLVSELQKQATGAVFDTIIVDTFRKMPVIIPPNNLVERFSDLCQSSFLMIENLQKSNKTLSTARDLLLPRLMSGEITVS